MGRPTRYGVAPLWVLFLLETAGCGAGPANDGDAGEPGVHADAGDTGGRNLQTDDGGGADSRVAVPADAGAGDGSVDAADGSSDRPRVDAVELTHYEALSTSCNDFCATQTWGCVASCGSDADPWAQFAWYGDASPISRSIYSTTRSSTDCNQVPPATAEGLEAQGEEPGTYDLSALRCCCLAPALEVLHGSADDPRSCQSVCGEAGRGCDDTHDWSGRSQGGARFTYATGSGAFVVGSFCAVVPPATESQGGTMGTLLDIECGCR